MSQPGTPSVARSTAMMSVFTLLSRVTGFIRMWATALALGATGLTAAYNVANNVPNMIYELVAGGILSSLFIPTFMSVRADEGDEAAWRFASHVLNVFVLLLGVVALLGTLFPEPFIWTQTFRLSSADSAAVRAPAEAFFRFFAIQIVLYGAGAVVQGLNNARRSYLWTALGPVFNNITVIATMLLVAFAPLGDTSNTVLAIGTTTGVAVMFATMVPTLVKGGMRYTPGLGLSDPALRRMLLLALPTIGYVITNLIAVSFRNASAFAVADNGPSVLMYAWTFYQLPYGILAVSLATALFTELSDAAGRGDHAGFRANVDRGLRATASLMLPAAALLFALAEPLTRLYVIGRFKTGDVPAVASALRYWALGLVFYACMMFVLRSFYALKDTRTPMLANAGTTVIQIAGYWVLTTGFGAWGGMGLDGIPLADGIFCLAQFTLLAWLLRRRIGSFGLRRFASSLPAAALTAIACGAAAWGVSLPLAAAGEGAGGAVVTLLAAGTVGLAVAWAVGRTLDVAGVRDLESRVSGALRKLRRG